MTRLRNYAAGVAALWLGIGAASQSPKTVQVPGSGPPAPVTKPAKPVTKPQKKKKKSGKRRGQRPGAAKPKGSGKSKKPTGPRGQLRPTAERYKQIEEALASRGYLKEEPSGKWTDASAEALRNFQSDHNLTPTGRLDSVSLIQLGLGPKQE
ncbi:MAG: peptidoglycan-binding protein [Acidobacteria bacterium]|nr:peptidoglycan-binding protein [Acidobacteriota bacterium]